MLTACFKTANELQILAFELSLWLDHAKSINQNFEFLYLLVAILLFSESVFLFIDKRLDLLDLGGYLGLKLSL
jgi:hypothetical protein